MSIDLIHFLVAPLVGLGLDLVIGDPFGRFHPVCWIGALISFLEKHLLKAKDSDSRKRLNGTILTILVVLTTTLITVLILMVAHIINPWLGFVVDVLIAWSLVATKSMQKAAMDVYRPLSGGDVFKGRKKVAMIVGRDTDKLDAEGIAKACVESVAESTSDGIIAPLFYLGLLGPVGMMIYKACNTMDSMIAYKNDKYRTFGTCAAKQDDVVNFVPSRLSALLMILSAFALKMDGRHAFAIFKRDRFNHASPNSAQTESVCAGALHVRLAGDAIYFGKVVHKPYIGDNDRPIEVEDIKRSIKLMYGTALGGALVMLILRLVVYALFI
ncbi:MAG: cobalamin biosynthesis protein CobD [Lachnospiraceae bacterium]|nr:cobalamin biosynthesis protein CobD [Candidatus Equihabitans merdae]